MGTVIHSTGFKVPPEFRVAAVSRLLGLSGDTPEARRFIADAPGQGVDLAWMWAWGMAPEADDVRSTARIDQVALIVPGAGRVGMVFAGGPRYAGDEGETAQIAGAIDAACVGVRAEDSGSRVALVQALVESGQDWYRSALVRAGFVSVGRLLYLRRANNAPRDVPGDWPQGVEVRPIASLGDRAAQDRALVDCLDRSYQGTLDCPELCGLRDTPDILASHRACGKHDPSLWWVASEGGRVIGCALFNPYPEQGSIELVYLGLAPEARGRGLGVRLARHGLASLPRRAFTRVACAVDERNAPARRLYDRLGFTRFDAREAYIRKP
ncbi:MAG: GNAT family N-acetyltransferase [Phycisphaeraceae bacterium]|nr:GNAT family N-acetyltransferase [Phycisphaeraceae bacterium]